MNSSMVVTGSSGFIGSHLCAHLAARGENGSVRGLDIVPPGANASCHAVVADINSAAQIRQTSIARADTVFHLAAKAEVVVPFGDLPDLNTTNVTGTVNVLTAFAPRTLVFASTSAVYGNGARPSVGTDWCNVNPVGVYGMTKATAELACADWARRTGGAAIRFRLGNVIGARCRGLIPYLVRHAMKYPDGSVPVRMRGAGQIVRDYVPVSYVVDIFCRASQMAWPAGGTCVFNIGTGRGLTNGDVARVVQDLLRARGYELRPDPCLPLEHGEAEHVVLNVTRMFETFGVPVPDRGAVLEAIAQAVDSWLEAA